MTVRSRPMKLREWTGLHESNCTEASKRRKKDATKKRDAEKEQDLPPKKRPTTRSAPSSSM